MPGIDYHELRRQITMREVLDLIGFQTSWRHGSQLRGPCPIPDCRSTSGRSFSVHLTRQVYHCFACQSHGNSLDLWVAVRGLSLHHAALDLCRILNLEPPLLPTSHLISLQRRPRSVASRAPSRNR
jgi:DNA primase